MGDPGRKHRENIGPDHWLQNISPVFLFVAKHDLHEILDNQLIIALNTI